MPQLCPSAVLKAQLQEAYRTLFVEGKLKIEDMLIDVVGAACSECLQYVMRIPSQYRGTNKDVIVTDVGT